MSVLIPTKLTEKANTSNRLRHYDDQHQQQLTPQQQQDICKTKYTLSSLSSSTVRMNSMAQNTDFNVTIECLCRGFIAVSSVEMEERYLHIQKEIIQKLNPDGIESSQFQSHQSAHGYTHDLHADHDLTRKLQKQQYSPESFVPATDDDFLGFLEEQQQKEEEIWILLMNTRFNKHNCLNSRNVFTWELASKGSIDLQWYAMKVLFRELYYGGDNDEDQGDHTQITKLFEDDAPITGHRIICSWTAVHCSREGRVVKIDSFSRDIRGTLPPEIGLLTDLESFTGTISGTIPTEVGLLKKLKDLDLSLSMVTGSIPSQIQNMDSLVVFNVIRNRLTGTIPTEIGNLKNLVKLLIGRNKLSGTFPSEISNLKLLDTLIASGNHFTDSFPTHLGELSSLMVLDLGTNYFQSATIPSFLWRLQELRTLILRTNELEGTIPGEGLAKLSNLEHLSLGSNTINGTIPTEIGLLTKLAFLSSSSNLHSGSLPSTLGLLTGLESLDLRANMFTGTVPTEINQLSNLLLLDFSKNTALHGNLEGLCRFHGPSRNYQVSLYQKYNQDVYIPKIKCTCCLQV
eukprot:CAMPEP_0202454960 /NCGR_PEP_ID=MMETSP1360-20130828/12594_1 /ASSEMBLY_ACC=CAM_ASM_000848 /TAXON_ID=515479 /ORGANISM="Licmophora paradoxa, Strain CCMP2313" /LENGTH=570 /DNA_ID=CAMNT_0049074425 /DNA_START=297 /DNA_END=2009 /DNA_ORIENTATION=-